MFLKVDTSSLLATNAKCAYVAIAHALPSKVYCDARKAALLRCEADDELNGLLTSDPLAADVHLLPLAMITSDKLKTYLQKYKGRFDKAVGFRPTGWT